MRRLFTSFFLIALLALAGCSRNESTESPAQNTQTQTAAQIKDPNYTQVAHEDVGMKAAREKARATTNDFLVAFKEQKPGTSEFFVKKAFPTLAAGEEHIWIRVLE